LEVSKGLVSGIMLNMVCYTALFFTFKYFSFTD